MNRNITKLCNLERFQIIRCLLAKGANVNNASEDGKTALTAVICKDCNECVKALIRAGADVNLMPVIGQTPLFVALPRAINDIPLSLMISGAKVNIVYKDGNTTQHKACVKYRDSTNFTAPFIVRYDSRDPEDTKKEHFTHISDIKCYVTTTPLMGGEEHPHTPLPQVLGVPNWRLCLMSQCREVIRRQMIDVDPHENLLVRIPRLGLPELLEKYLLYDVSFVGISRLQLPEVSRFSVNRSLWLKL